MKSILTVFLLAAMLVFGNTAKAQNAYEKGDKLLNLGVSLGAYSYGGYLGSRSGGFIPVNASLEIGVHDKFSIGPYIGYASWKYNHSFGKYGWSYTSIGARGSFHYLSYVNEIFEINIDESKWDFYATLFAGLEFRRFTSDDPYYKDNNIYNNSTNLFIGPVLGFKYMFTDKFGVYFEGGRGALGYSTLGLNVKF